MSFNPLPGTPILSSDLGDIAAYANSKGNLINCNPSILNNSQYYPFINISVSNGGSAYILGDVISMGFGDSFEVIQTNANGGIIAIHQIAQGQLNSGNTPPGQPASATGGSGTGSYLNWQTGSFINGGSQTTNPTPYGFNNYDRTLGAVTGLFINNPGFNYNVNDNLVIPISTGISFISASVTSVDASGSITGITINTGSGGYTGFDIGIPTGTQNMAATSSLSSGSGAYLGAYLYYPQAQSWLTELNRLRENLNYSLNGGSSNPWNYFASQYRMPLAATNPYIMFGSVFLDGSYHLVTGIGGGEVSIYYEINGNPDVTVQLQNNGGAASVDPSTQFQPSSSQQSCTFKLEVRGTVTGQFSGSFFVQCATGDGGHGTFTCDTDFPGCNFSPLTISDGLVVSGLISDPIINVTCPPGTYTFTCHCSGQNCWFFAGGELFTVNGDGGGEPGYWLTYTIPSGNDYATPAIDRNSPVHRIDVWNADVGILSSSFGLYSYVPMTVHTGSGVSGSNTQYGFVLSGGLVYKAVNSSSSEPFPSFFSGFPTPISNLSIAPASTMPWNNIITKNFGATTNTYGCNPMLLQDLNNISGSTNSYTVAQTEVQLEPPVWKANTWFSSGFEICDSNLNLQQCVVAGFSNPSTHPNWPTTVGATVTETGQHIGVAQAIWKCIVSNVTPPSSSWQPGTYYPLGARITDDIGNIQQNTPLFNGQPNGGSSSATFPVWAGGLYPPANARQIGQQTGDPLLSQALINELALLTGSVSYPPLWTLIEYWNTSSLAINPAPARQTSNTIYNTYPYVWLQETDPKCFPPSGSALAPINSLTRSIWGCTDQWLNSDYAIGGHNFGWSQANEAQGLWIYSIIAQRIGNNYYGQTLLPMQDVSGSVEQITFQVGCMRGGSFQSFGTYTTGTTYTYMNDNTMPWPIFTSDPLYYSCTERLLLSIVPIGYGDAGVNSGVDIQYPLLAVHLTDTYQLLNLIS